MNKYYLIGMPGCGKSTIGKELAFKLGLGFVDLDKLIEAKSEMKITKIFELYGEKYFRDLESKLLAEFVNDDNIVISTGGGIVVKDSNKSLMNGNIVYLDVPISELKLRLSNDKSRPLLKTSSLDELYQKRSKAYNDFSTITIHSTIISDAVNKIIKETK